MSKKPTIEIMPPQKQQEAPEEVKGIPMKRWKASPGGATTAIVHPNEVGRYERAGWVRAKDEDE